MNQLVAAGILTKLGHVVEIAVSGAEAVASCSARRFDVVLMDVMMPEMDGFEATARIRSDDALLGRRTPILGQSCRDMPGDRGAALDAGMDEYLTKPIRPDDLQQALLRWTTTPARPAAREDA